MVTTPKSPYRFFFFCSVSFAMLYRLVPSFTEFTGFYLVSLLTPTVSSRFFLVGIGFYWVLLGFTGFYWVSPSFTEFSRDAPHDIGCYRVLPSFLPRFTVLSRFSSNLIVVTGFSWGLPSFTVFCHVLWSFFIGFSWVLPSFTEFLDVRRTTSDVTGFYRVFFSLPPC